MILLHDSAKTILTLSLPGQTSNVTVALNKDKYVKKIEIMLQDQNSPKNPMVTIEKSWLLNIWFQKDFQTDLLLLTLK